MSNSHLHCRKCPQTGLDSVQHALSTLIAHCDILRVRSHVLAPVIYAHIANYLQQLRQASVAGLERPPLLPKCLLC